MPMCAEIITVGDELITGHRIDTNSAFIAQQLTRIGLEVRYRSSVGDSLEMMEEVFRLALKRAQVVIVTGGLGPTDDDITKKAIVRVFKRNLIFHEELLEELKKRYAARGIEMPAINQNQALLPQGATVFPNKYGSAVGIGIAEGGTVFLALPGVPYEMKQIMTDEIIPYLQRLNIGQVLEVVSLRTTGAVESKLAELIAPGLKLEPGVKLAYLPAPSAIELRVLAAAATREEAQEKAQAVVRYLESTVGKYIFGRGDDTLEGVVGQLLVDNDKSLAVAESCTGGELGMLITSVPGASRYFLGGVVAYSNEAKTELLGVDRDIIAQFGAVSRECAEAMAEGCRRRFGADYALAVTGIAGPGGATPDKPVGTVWIGLASLHETYAKTFSLGTLRESIRDRAAYTALEMLRRNILDIT
ncbi:MAG TPA: competence/damage-inducible protein A [candidate division Zixibacteria bacterium]|nr:competence/damage-inducible protein A [candidate division Zixibacteria bacterium]MDD4916680.1 competence/damage-inducible protein A [candidate division Zixibacteria bacterium]MDM7973325.1 competence/damage-inducible protein A [candidate division Zixibacteria bacterium]HOD67230.1 competence/damage-inducible protein A [candidate division Zixibacteria bacterium]HPC10887.1 competence/damage-inducible protein A [candidate division Zixibacteria bacterium]